MKNETLSYYLKKNNEGTVSNHAKSMIFSRPIVDQQQFSLLNKMIEVSLHDSEAVINSLLQSQSKALILVVTQKNQQGVYWCSDCQALKPIFIDIQEESKQAKLPFYIFVAGDKPTWYDPQNKLKKNKALLIYQVPTLGLFDGKKLVRCLIEGEILDKQQRALIFE